MRSMPFIYAAMAAAVIALATAPAIAQAPAGPVRNPALDAAQLPSAMTLAPGFAAPYAAPAIDPAGDFAEQVPASKPHLYFSAPLSALMGVAGAVLGYGSGLVLMNCSDEGANCETGPDHGEYYLGATGLALGAASGAHFGGRRRDSVGNFGSALLGAAVGTLPVVLANKQNDMGSVSLVSLVAAPAGAVLMDYLVRKPRR